MKLLLWTLVISGIFQALYGTFMTLSGKEWLFLTPNIYAKGDAIGTVVMVIGLVMTHSRGGNSAFFASLLIVGTHYGLIDAGAAPFQARPSSGAKVPLFYEPGNAKLLARSPAL